MRYNTPRLKMNADDPGFDLNLIPEPYRKLLELVSSETERTHVPVFLAGGIVRDLLLGRQIKDLDLVVEGDAIRLARGIAKLHGGKVTSHPRFRTAMWELPSNLVEEIGSPASIDLASARSETYPLAGALPVVDFAGMKEDLSRRDFTINAMSVRLEDGRLGELLDPFGGKQDLERGLVRVLHERSFLDDPTRMLRGLRYGGRYGFALAPETRSIINPEAINVLKGLSGERLRNELDLILGEEHPAAVLQDAERLGLLSAIDPELPRFEGSYETLLSSAPDPALKLNPDRRELGYLLWLLDTSPEILSRLSRRLAFDGRLSRALRGGTALLRDLPNLRGQKPSAWTERLDRVDPAAIHAVLLRTGGADLERYLRTWRNTYPATSGEDLKHRGLEPGPIFKDLLTRLRAARLDGEVTSREDESALLDRLLQGRQGDDGQ